MFMGIKERLKKVRSALRESETAKKVIENSGWRVGNRVFTMIVGVFVVAIVARYFGPEKYGEFNYALSFVTLFSVAAALGLENVVVKALVEKERSEGTILCTALYLRLAAGLVLTGISYAAFRLLEPDMQGIQLLVLVLSFLIVTQAFDVIAYWVQAHHRARLASIIRMAAYVVTAGLKLMVVYLHGTILHFGLVTLFDVIIVGGALFVAYLIKRKDKSKWRFDFSYGRQLLARSWPLLLSAAMTTLYARIDQVMLGAMLPDKSDVGIYSAAVQIAQMWFFVPMALIVSFKPVIMGKKNEGGPGYMRSVQLLYTILAWVGIGFGILITLLSGVLVDVIYGSEYMLAANILMISVWAGIFSTIDTARALWLVSENLQKYTLLFVAAGAVVNVALNAALIPVIFGFGAAVASLISQVMVAVVVPAFFKKTRVSAGMILKAFAFAGVRRGRDNGQGEKG